jgi:hypothetical protein
MNERPSSDHELADRAGRLGALAQPVPEPLLAAARDAFGLRELDARVAELVGDSAVDAPASAARGPGPRMLSFESGEVAVECEITAHDSRRDICGRLVGGVAPVLDAQVAGEAAVTVRVDGDGRFGIRDLRAGPVRLRCHLADGTTLVTSWAVILLSGREKADLPSWVPWPGFVCSFGCDSDSTRYRRQIPGPGGACHVGESRNPSAPSVRGCYQTLTQLRYPLVFAGRCGRGRSVHRWWWRPPGPCRRATAR